MSDSSTQPAATSTSPGGDVATTAPVATGTTEPKTDSILGSASNPDGQKDQGQPATENKTTPEAGAEIEVVMPEGFEIDTAMLDGFKTVGKEIGLDSAKASRLASWYAQQAQASEKALAETWEKQSAEWESGLKADPEFGGAKYAGSVEKARAAVLKFGGPELAAELNKYRIGNLPTLVRAFAKIGASIGEDSSSVKSPGGPVELSEAERNKLRYNKSH